MCLPNHRCGPVPPMWDLQKFVQIKPLRTHFETYRPCFTPRFPFWKGGRESKVCPCRPHLECSPKTGPVIMQIVQLAETRERLHAKANQSRPDCHDPPRSPGRPRRRAERQPGVPQGRDQPDHVLPMEGPPAGPRIERPTPHV